MRRSDPNAAEMLFATLRSRLLKQVRWTLRGGWTESWAEDLVQDALVDILQYGPGCRATSIAELQLWLRRIRDRRIAALFRAEGRRAVNGVALQDDLPADADLPHAWMGELIRAFAPLTDPQERLLWLRLQERATWPEIAASFGISPAAAKRRYQRLCKRLAGLLDEPRADAVVRRG
jgi:RNA polymerase sigma factor (sigma-70 family)